MPASWPLWPPKANTRPEPDADWRRRFLERREADLAALDRLAADLQARQAVHASHAEQDRALPPDPTNSLTPRLDALIALLDGADLEALDVHQALRPLLPAGTAATPLDEAMAALDFPTALHLCRQLRATLEART